MKLTSLLRNEVKLVKEFWKRGRYHLLLRLAILLLPLCSFAPFQAQADDIFYCYGQHYGSFNNLQQTGTILVPTAPSNIRPYRFYDYSLGINLTKKQIGYSLDNISGRREVGEESKTLPERWVEANEVKVDKARWVLRLPIQELSEREHAIETVYFDQENLYFTRIWYEIGNVSSISVTNTFNSDYTESLSSYNPHFNASKRDPIFSLVIVTTGQCRKR